MTESLTTDAARRVAARQPSFVQRGTENFRQTLREAAQYRQLAKTPYGLRPILIFTLISIVLNFDGRIFALAQVRVVQELDIDYPTLIQVLNTLGLIFAILVVFFAWATDRVKRRVPLIGVGTIIMGLSSLWTSRATNLYNYGYTRGVDSVGSVVLGVPENTLRADYYPVDSRGKAFAFSGILGRLTRIGAPIIMGYVLLHVSWRTPYVVTGVLLVISGVLALVFLKEPVRGYFERKAMGATEEEARDPEPPPSFGEGWRSTWSIRTLRRLFIASIFGNAADFSFGLFLTPFLFEKYNLTELELGYIFAGIAAAALPFGFLAGGLVDVLVRRAAQRVLVFSGILGVLTAFAVLGIAVGPPLWVFILIYVLFACSSALIGPAEGVLYVNIVPAHIRGIGTSVLGLAEVPSALLRGAVIGYFVSRYGVQGGIYASVPFYLIAGIIQLSGAGLFPRDMRAALSSQLASHEWKRAREEGRGKLLVCRDVDVEYDGVQVLFGVDFDVDDDDIIALLGTNGAGKSTLLRAIAGAHEASAGAIVFDGRDITHVPPNEIAKRGVMLMPGGKGVFPDLTVQENLMLGNWMTEEEDAESRLDEIYEIFPILKDRGGERAQLLSGGEQQMLSLALAFLSKPRLLMIDELSLGLSPATVQQLVEIVRKIHKQGTTVIVVEQSVNVALTLCDRAIFMEKGEVKFIGRTSELLRRPDILRAVYVKGTGALTAGGTGSALKTERELRQYGLERARPIVEVQNVSKAFGGVVAVDDVSFVLREGEALGLIGPNGAGKTTVFDLISGYQLPDSGSIVMDGVDVTIMPAEERAKLGLVRRFQDARLFPSLSVYENLLVALERRMEVRSMVLTSLQLPQARQAERRVRRRAERLVELLELGAYRDKFVKELSTGLRRITDLACVLATEPKVLLLDEPSTGIAQAEAENLAPLLRRVRFETGCSLLIIEHDMPLISALADELIAMDQGAVLLRGTADTVLNDDRVVESYLGTSEDIIKRQGIRT